jgi:hypothetical protein
VDWKSEAERLRFDEGLSWSEIAAELGKYFPNLNSRQVFEKVRSYIRKTDRYKEAVQHIKVKPKEDKPKKIDVVQNRESKCASVTNTLEDKLMDTETAYENLANAIVLQAVKDYRTAKRFRNGGSIGVIRKFFRSDWFRTLTNIDGEWLIRKLDEEAAHDKNRMVQQGMGIRQGNQSAYRKAE